MTEAEWLTCSEPVRMLKAAKSRFRHRKLRLLAVACAAHVAPLLPDARSHDAITVAERFADGGADDAELRTAWERASSAHREAFRKHGKDGKRGSCLEWAAQYTTADFAFKAAESVSWMAATARKEGDPAPADYTFQAVLVRDIFGNPFQHIAPDSAWLTPAVVSYSRMIYNERAFERMPELADVRKAAGCTNADILEHCRGPGPHVRGCWVVDLVLGKS